MVEQELVHAIEAVLNSKKNIKSSKKVLPRFLVQLKLSDRTCFYRKQSSKYITKETKLCSFG